MLSVKIKFSESAQLKTKASAEEKSRVGQWRIFKRAVGSGTRQKAVKVPTANCYCPLLCG